MTGNFGIDTVCNHDEQGMPAPFSYLWNIAKRGRAWAAPVPSAIFLVFNYFEFFKDMPGLTKTAIGISLLLSGALVCAVRGGYCLVRDASDEIEVLKQQVAQASAADVGPLTVRNVREGEGYHEGTMLMILDKAPWIEAGLILSLSVEVDSVTPVALLYVETFTSEAFPQCIVWRAYGPAADLRQYLNDPSRWKSLKARRNVHLRHLEKVNHE
ncbi:hypothetical protein [Achromobacter sp. E1]|uniref:hypothetical protein n=1 Tax=Achromobacter sp. E1 TaxID=3141581 RepID=UPI0030D51F32